MTMKRHLDKRNNFGRIWTARTRNFTISLMLEQSSEKYNGEDDGEIQEAIDNGDMIYFDSKLVVEYDDMEIGSDYLGASCYKDGEAWKFVHDGYFRDMLATACREAREHFANVPKMRAV